jgi:hypothetical protein
MGYMTTITILNDAWDQIKKNPEQFIENINKGMSGIGYFGERDGKTIHSYPVGNHANPMDVARSHHADEDRLYLAFENSLFPIGDNDMDCIKDIEYRKRILERVKWWLKIEEKRIRELE